MNFTLFGIPIHFCQDELRQILMIGPFLAAIFGILIKVVRRKKKPVQEAPPSCGNEKGEDHVHP